MKNELAFLLTMLKKFKNFFSLYIKYTFSKIVSCSLKLTVTKFSGNLLIQLADILKSPIRNNWINKWKYKTKHYFTGQIGIFRLCLTVFLV